MKSSFNPVGDGRTKAPESLKFSGNFGCFPSGEDRTTKEDVGTGSK